MSVAQSMAPPDRGVSPLMSNNPFRNRVASNNMQAAGRPVSTNPFLDVSELDNLSGSTSTSQPTSNYTTVDKATDIFATMELNQSAAQQNGARIPNGQPRRPENHPPSQRHQFPRPPTAHRPSNSEEEARRIPTSRPKQELDIFADPPELKSRDRERRPRRNSESSVRDKPARMLSPEDEKRRRERKMREKEAAGKDGKDASKSKKPSRKLDVIDKLDVTSIYGTGLFHHDGPFDACNPHRNRKKEKYAPMHAFPKDSVNMIIGGSGPVNNKLDYDKFHGVGKEAHVDYHIAPTAEQSAAPPEFVRKPNGEPQESGFDPNAREVIHGDESQGLGTSTFLEGAPASRTAIQRRESEYEVQQSRDGAPGLSRKKSLAQKIRGVRPNRDRLTSPEGRASASSPPLGTSQSDTVANPFFKDFEKDKNTAVAFADEPKPNRARAPSSPMRNELERRNTTDSAPDESQPKSGGGFLGRMKSLKGGPRRPARVTTPGA